MPLLRGKENIGKNIRELEEHGSQPRSKEQILAIALKEAGLPKRKKKKESGARKDS